MNTRLHLCIRLERIAAAAALASGLAGCAGSGLRHEVVLARDVQVTVGSEKASLHKRGETIELHSTPVLLESPGHVSMLLVPPVEGSTSGKVKVDLKSAEGWGGQAEEERVSRSVNEAVFAINDIQTLLASGHAQEALAKLDDLQKRYPRAAALKFLRASCFVVMGDHAQARAILQNVLEEFPDNNAGQELLQALGGKRAPASRGQKKKEGDEP